MKRARILVDTDCGVWGTLFTGTVRSVVELTEDRVTVRFAPATISIIQPVTYLKSGNVVVGKSRQTPIPDSRTIVLPLESVELTDDLETM